MMGAPLDLAPLSPFAAGAPDAVAAGFHVLAIEPGHKRPGTYINERWGAAAGWQHYATAAASDKVIANWTRAPGAGLGIAMGSPAGEGHYVVAVDIDLDESDKVAAVRDALPATPVMKTGAKGVTLLYRAPAEIVSTAYNIGTTRAVDLLAKGRQTVMPPTIHPSGVPYRFIGAGLVPAHELPIFGADEKGALEAALRGLGWQDGTIAPSDPVAGVEAPSGDRGERGAVGDYFREINDAALSALAAWVPALGLPNLVADARGGFAATAFWRPSSSGRDLAARKANLSFSRKGIVDFGDGDKGYTSVDVVVAAMGTSPSDAAAWLRERLGLDVDDGFFALPEASLNPFETSRRLVEHGDGSLVDERTGEFVGGANDNQVAPAAGAVFPEHLTRPAGVLGEMVSYIMATAQKPSGPLALGASLVALGSLCGRRDATPTMSGTHLYVIGLAATGVGKQHPQDAGEAMVQAATDDRRDDIMGPSDLMSEGALIKEITYRPHSCSYIDEFGDLVSKMNSPNPKSFETGIKKALLQIWGKSFAMWRTPSYAARRGVPIHTPSFSLFGASTPNRFYDAMNGEDSENGFLNRFLLIPELEKVASVEPTFDWRRVPADLVNKLRRIYELEREELDTFDADGKPLDDPWRASIEPHRRVVGWASDEAKAINDAFRAECDGLGHFFARSAEMAGRIATIVAVGREWEAPAVDVDDIAYGVELARWSATHMAQQATDFVSSGAAGMERSKILRKVRAEGGRVAQSEVLKHLGLSAKVLAEHVRDMGPNGTGQLDVESVAPANGGRAKTYLRLAET